MLVAKEGKIIYHKSFGHHTYERVREVRNSDIYDLSSITKILASMQFIGLNKDYIKSRNEKIKAIKSSDIALVANRLLSSKDFTIVIVGEPQGLWILLKLIEIQEKI